MKKKDSDLKQRKYRMIIMDYTFSIVHTTLRLLAYFTYQSIPISFSEFNLKFLFSRLAVLEF